MEPLVCYEATPIHVEAWPGKGMVADIYATNVAKIKAGKFILLNQNIFLITEVINYTGLKEDTMIGVVFEECNICN
jgi:hypothetical protein